MRNSMGAMNHAPTFFLPLRTGEGRGEVEKVGMKYMAMFVLVLLTACTGCDNNEETFPDPAFKACVEKELASLSKIDEKEYLIENANDLGIITFLACRGGVP